MLAPIVAPIIGSLILYTTGSWQNIFHFLTIYGVIILILTLIMPETHPSYKLSKNLVISFKTYLNNFMNIPFIFGV
ncbi:Bcr/CflA family drug resistance efflux transporter, partial [Francisella tularensis subsp. holarctica]|nr:Bcr/CflA family drug resistance efflux transporter [Francisella tularensis subsp. holarctica]